MEHYKQQIIALEKSTRVALTRKYPALLPIILGLKRFLNTLVVNFQPKFFIRKITTPKWFHLTEHSAPLFRKYNKKELDEGKINNINLAIQAIDGLVINPGKTFSFWKFVGNPSHHRGFKSGLVLSAGTLQEDVGGGLCQLSNLIAYMFACTECEFIERKHHSRDVFPDSGRVVPFASGATVSFNLIDLKIKNTYSFPIKINLHTTATQLRGSLDCETPLDYFVKIEEKDGMFIKSQNTGLVYRCNEIMRVFYSKKNKLEMKRESLWRNVAQVMYDEKSITQPIMEWSKRI